MHNGAGVALVVGGTGLLLALAALAWWPPRPHVEIVGGDLVVRPRGPDTLLCVSGPIAVPLDRVTLVRAVNRTQAPALGERISGAYLPGVITAGTYASDDGRTFWDVRRASRVLMVSCRHSAYRALVVQVPDPDALAARLRDALPQGVRSRSD